jgi:hypothetical protein
MMPLTSDQLTVVAAAVVPTTPARARALAPAGLAPVVDGGVVVPAPGAPSTGEFGVPPVAFPLAIAVLVQVHVAAPPELLVVLQFGFKCSVAPAGPVPPGVAGARLVVAV